MISDLDCRSFLIKSQPYSLALELYNFLLITYKETQINKKENKNKKYFYVTFTIRNFSKWILSKHIKLKRKIRKSYLTLLKSVEWQEKDWLVYECMQRGEGGII